MSAPDRLRRGLVDAALLATVVALFLAPALDPGRQFGARDNGRMHLPVKAFLAGELAQGRLPAWNPYAGLGAPLLAGMVDAPLHPFNLLLLALPFDWGFKAWVFLSLVLGGLGAGALALQLGASRQGARVGALAFALTGFLVSSTDNLTYLTAAATVPWLLAAGQAHARAGRPLRLFSVLLASFLLLAAGDPISWAAALAALPLLAWASTLGEAQAPRARRVGRTGLALAAALAGAAPLLLPLLLNLGESSRHEALQALEFGRWNLHPARLLELAVPYLARSVPGALEAPAFRTFFGNAATPVPWALSLYAGAVLSALAALGAARRPGGRVVLALGAATAWAAAGPHLGFGALAARLPVLSSIRYWERLGGLVALALAVAGALGATELLARAPSRRLLGWLGAAAGTVLLAAAGLAPLEGRLAAWLAGSGGALPAAELIDNLSDGLRHAGGVLAALALLAWGLRRGRLGRLAPLLLAALVVVDLAASNTAAYVLPSLEALRPPQPLAAPLQALGGLQRVATPIAAGGEVRPGELAFEATARANARLLDGPSGIRAGVGNLSPYVGLVPARLFDLQLRLGTGGLARAAGRWGVSHLALPGDPAQALRQLGFPAPLPVVATDPAVPASLLLLPHRPRAYLADAIATVDAAGALAFALAAEAPGLGAVVEGPVPPEATGGAAGQATVLRDEPSLVTVALSADRSALLVLDDMYARGWTAELDGRPVGVVRANWLVRGVWVPAGAHQVEVRDRTPGLAAGLALLGATALALVAWAWRRRRARPA
jgi:hypothetical protein